MDVNGALESLRDNAQRALKIAYHTGENPSKDELVELLKDIGETFDNLDVVITRDGVLPDDWGTP